MTQDAKQATVSRLYDGLYDMAVSFDLKPGERLNEVELARQLGASRTPLREALNRLVSEGFLRFESGRGFFCRDFRPQDIFNLYQIREALESFAVRVACESATAEQIAGLEDFLDRTGPDEGGRGSAELVALDEEFHETLAGFIISQLGDLPRTGEQVLYGNLRFVVHLAEARTVKEVELFVEPPSA